MYCIEYFSDAGKKGYVIRDEDGDILNRKGEVVNVYKDKPAHWLFPTKQGATWVVRKLKERNRD